MSQVRKRSNSDSQTRNKRRKPQILQHKSSNPVNPTSGISECFHKITTSLYVSLAPSYLNAPLEGLKSQHLDPMLMKHFPQANGVVIGYDKLQLSSEHKTEMGIVAKVNPHSPFAFFWISVDLLIWKPQFGDVLEGVIYMQSPSHIGLLINDTFNASIKKNNIPETWQFVPNQVDEVEEEESDGDKVKSQSLGQWLDENELPIDGKIKFTVKGIHTSGRVVSVEGSLITPGSETETQPVVPNKKIRFDDLEPTSVDANANNAAEVQDELPAYIADSDDEKKVIAEDDSSDDDDSDSD